jgi:hypothetical protein
MKTPRSAKFSIFISRGAGRVRSFRISVRILFFSSLFLGCFLIVSVIIVNKYIDELFSKEDQSLQLRLLRTQLDHSKRALYRSRQRLALLEDHLRDLDKDAEIEAGVAEDPLLAAGDAGIEPEDKEAKGDQDASQEIWIAIEAPSIYKAGGRLKAAFRLKNEREHKGSVSGYVYMIAMDEHSDPPQLQPYPKVALRNGIPVDYKRGQPFSIKRFKTIRGEYSLNSKTEGPSTIKVLVYDTSGKLILDREFRVSP